MTSQKVPAQLVYTTASLGLQVALPRGNSLLEEEVDRTGFPALHAESLLQDIKRHDLSTPVLVARGKSVTMFDSGKIGEGRVLRAVMHMTKGV